MNKFGIFQKDEEEWRDLIDERSILLGAWFLRFSSKKRDRIKAIDKRLDELEMAYYKYIKEKEKKHFGDRLNFPELDPELVEILSKIEGEKEP